MKIEIYTETVQNIDVCRNINANGNNDSKWKRPVSGRQIIYVLFHMWCIEKQKQVCTHDTVEVKLQRGIKEMNGRGKRRESGKAWKVGGNIFSAQYTSIWKICKVRQKLSKWKVHGTFLFLKAVTTS